MLEKKPGVMPLLAAFWTGLVLCLSGAFVEGKTFLDTLTKETEAVGIDKLVIIFALAAFYIKMWEKFREGRRWITHLLAFCFAGFMIIGISFSTQGNWAFIFGNKYQMCIAALAFGGYFILFDVALSVLYSWMKKRNFYHMGSTKPFPAWIEKHYFLFSFLVIYICWLPFLIIFFPGSLPSDGYRQLDMFFGGEPFTTRHAWVLTMFVGFLMKIGRTISDNAGIFLIVLVTSVMEALCYAVVCAKVKAWKAPRAFVLGSLAMFGCLPVFGAYAQTVIKDGVFSGFLALFMALYAECAIPALQKQNEEKLTKQLLILTGAAFLTCFTRNNGIYLVFPAMLLLVFMIVKKKRILVLVLAFTVLGGYTCSEKVIAPALGIEQQSSRVFYTIPFQQTSRYLQTYPEDVTEEEKEAIDSVLQYVHLAERYDPDIVDPIKKTFRTDTVTGEDLKNYMKVWFDMFKRHPGVYIEATLHGTYGYYYPFHFVEAQGAYKLYTTKGDSLVFDHSYAMPGEIRKELTRYAYFWNHVPGLAQLSNSGTYTWILMILAGYLIYRKRWKGLLMLAAPFLNVAVCIASPVNGLFRYVFPIVACMPVVIYWCLCYGEQEFLA